MNWIVRSGLTTALSAGILCATPAFAEGDPEAGRVKASTCMGCHGIPNYSNVYPTFHVPKIGGQHAEYLAEALMAYKTGEREHPTMQAQAASLSDQDIRDIAAFFSQAPKKRR